MNEHSEMKFAGTSLKPLEIWRPDVSLADAFDFSRSLAVAALRAGSGSMVTAVGARPARGLVLYERENCPFSRLVRESLSDLDLDVLIKPCPEGERLHRAELRGLSGHERVPFLLDEGIGVHIGESKEIIRHLFDHYGHGRVPLPLRWHKAAELSSKLASHLRGRSLRYVEPAQRPMRPLELWGYEASPYSRVVRERLGELGLMHVSHNLARRSPRRGAFVDHFGKAQFPRLFDPNLGLAMFESDDIVEYLNTHYARALVLPSTGFHAEVRHAQVH